ncbi:MAG: threonylcarbamoyl-AMP synthase [Planctomycetaceae bacterium]|nr:threonylcarbamoyl-AMP synthase [Planctomycetaceae bacterium]
MKTELLFIADRNSKAALHKAARLLDEGALVAVPTETVYGIGCRVEAASLERLNGLKDRAPDKRYTLHIGSHVQLKKYVPTLNLRARKLVHNGLPGPITVVFELSSDDMVRVSRELPEAIVNLLYVDNTLGIRYPSHPIAAAILAQTHHPIVAPSANPANKEPARTTQEVLKYFADKIDYVVDTPEPNCAYNQSSTVVKVGRLKIDILRQGAVPAQQIQDWSALEILFVCAGNTCRSPMAEAVCRKYFADILGCSIDEVASLGYKISSAGISSLTGAAPSDYAAGVCRENQVSLEGHRSRPLTLEMIERSDLIFAMSRSQWLRIVELDPLAERKCFLLDENADIADPIGFGCEVYRQCFRQIEKAVQRRMCEIL